MVTAIAAGRYGECSFLPRPELNAMADLDSAFNRAADDAGREIEKDLRRADELLDLLRKAAAEAEAQMAAEIWTLILVTADGATRREQWKGRPPLDYRTPLARRFTGAIVDHGRAPTIADVMPVRIYELEAVDSRRHIARYRERI
jgi:hypothetical protein